MEKKIRIGIIGCGGIATCAHVPAFKVMPEAEITAICDIIPEKMDKIEKLIDGKVEKYTDYKKLLDNKNVDAVHICTPNCFHSEMAVAALEKGKHVFCEKPDAMNVTEVIKMRDTAKKSKSVLMVMRNNRHLNSSKYLKKKIENGEFGDLYCGRCGWIRRRGIPGKGGWFTTKSLSGGGPLIDLGVHMIDLSIYLMGNPRPVAVSGSVYNHFADGGDISDSQHSAFGDKVKDGIFDVEDHAIGFVRFENGASLQIEFSWASNIEAEKNFVELRGSKAGFTWENGKCRIFGEENGALTDIMPAFGADNGHKNNIQHFLNVINKKEKPDFVIEQGVHMIKILQAIYESAKTGKEILLNN